MTSDFKKYKIIGLLLVFIMITSWTQAQIETSKWKVQFAVGANNPINNNNDGYSSKSLNFPTINLGVQHMFTKTLGAKADFGYNRSVSSDNSLAFKLNYSRVNLQFVYDAYGLIKFLPTRMNFVGHIGPGVSFTKPLGNFAENKYTFLNALAGLELHYGVSRSLSVYGDISYVLSLGSDDKYDVAVDGFSFNGDMMYVTIGVAVSLSGCYYCE